MQEIDKPGPTGITVGENGASQKEIYSPNDLVVVLDTSFLVQLSNNTLWSYSTWFKAKREALQQRKKFRFFISNPVRFEFNRLLQERRVDNYGLPLVNQPLEELMGSLQDIDIGKSDLSYKSAREAWTSNTSQRFNSQSSRVRRGPINADLSVAALAREIARYGADVWVASYDMKDVIGPLESDTQRLLEEGLKITPITSFKVEKASFAGTDYVDKKGDLFPVLSREVIADLQAAKLHPGAFTYVIFERDVRSGDVSFDVAVGVVEFKNLKEVKIPQEYRGGGKQLSLIPVVRLSLPKDENFMRGYFRRSNSNVPYRLLVVKKEDPLFPVLIFPSGSQDNWFKWQRSLQVRTDFLSRQTDSPYAQRHY